MKHDVLELFIYAVEHNLWDLQRGLYPEVISSYKSNPKVINYANEAMRLMNVRMNGMRRGMEYDPATSYQEW